MTIQDGIEMGDIESAVVENTVSQQKDKATQDMDGGEATVSELFMLADSNDWILIVTGTVFAILQGIGQPLVMVLFANSMQAMSDPSDALKVRAVLCCLRMACHYAALVG